jgi:hypothetical protein
MLYVDSPQNVIFHPSFVTMENRMWLEILYLLFSLLLESAAAHTFL